MSETKRSAKATWITRILSVFSGLVLVGLLAAVIVSLAMGRTHQAVVVAIAYFCGILLLGPLLYLLRAYGSWRSSNRLWRKRMASGFYKTLPPVKDDDGD
jgi:hypothetical protein